MSITELVSMIPDWLAATAGREVSIGLSRKEALRRASVLRGILRAGTLEPARVALDDDLKAVFQALVELVTVAEPDSVVSIASEANELYQFLAGVQWPNDEFQEKRNLLHLLAAAGWRSLGTSQEIVDMARGEAFCYWPSMHVEADTEAALGVEAEVKRLQTLARLGQKQSLDRNQHPRRAAEELARTYDEVLASSSGKPLFDLRDALLGDLATAAATALRNIGEFGSAHQWLGRAESWYGLLPSPNRGIARVRFCSLAIEFQLRHYRPVLAALPELLAEFDHLGMRKWQRLGRYLEGSLLKSLNRDSEAIRRFQIVLRDSCEEGDVELQGYALVEIGGCHGRSGDLRQALAYYEAALKITAIRRAPILEANLAGLIGETYRLSGNLQAAVAWLKRALNGYETAGVSVETANLRLLLADALISMGLPELAHTEIVAALPIIEEKQLVPDGHMAVALLRESIRQSRADPNALRELREHLQRQH